MKAGSCPNRAESSGMDTKSKSLVLVNYFPTDPNANESCVDNSAPLLSMMNTCYTASGNRWPNFIAVDFYQVYICVCVCVRDVECFELFDLQDLFTVCEY